MKTHFKTLCKILFILAFINFIIPAYAQQFIVDGFIYESINNDYLRLIGITDELSSGGDITIPNSVRISGLERNLPVKTVADDIFNDISVHKITYGSNIDSIGRIGDNDFLLEIDLSQSIVDEIPFCYASNSKVKSLKLPGTLKLIGAFSFTGTALESLDLPDLIENVDDDAFSGCFNLNHLKMNQQLKYIGEHAFAECPLEDIEWSDNIVSFGYHAFSCAKFKEIIIPETATSISFSFTNIQTLKSVKCFIKSPTQIAYQVSAFDESDLSDCILWVMPGTAELFKANPNWSSFADIREMDQTQINEINYSTTEGNHIFDLSGRRVTNCMPGNIYISKGQQFLYR